MQTWILFYQQQVWRLLQIIFLEHINGAVEYLWDGGYDFSYHENGMEYYDTEVEDCDYNEEVEYSACLISKFS